MSNFNEFFKNKGLKTLIDKFVVLADGYSKDNSTKHRITNLKYWIEKEPNHTASYFIDNKLTASHLVKITYDLDNDGTIRESEFEIPREIDGAFIIEGSYRVSTNRLGNDYDCRMNFNGPGDRVVKFDYDRRYDIDKKQLRLRYFNPDLGIKDEEIVIPYDEIDEYEDQEKLKLTERQCKKFQVKLDIDYKPEYITRKLIDDCIAFGDDRYRDLVVDKSIESVPQSFMQYIFRDNNCRNYWGTLKKIKTYFFKQGKLQEQLNPITNLAFRFWKGDKDVKTKDIQVPPGINAINLESLKSKITIPDTVAYNETMGDLIDVTDTPINQNVGKQNSLNVCVHLSDDGVVLMDVYDKDFKKISMDYLDYLNSKVVASEYVDYETKRLVPNQNNQVEVKHRMKRKMVDVSEIDLIDLHPDYRLSTSVRRIPFVNFTDSSRIMMGSSMLKQSIPLANAERPLVDSGNYDDLDENVLHTKFQESEGVVKDITEESVEIELPNKEIVSIPRRSAIKSLNDVTIWTEPKVKVGDKVKQGDMITGAHEVEKDTVKSGMNTFVLYSAYKGLVHEDAVVISESYAEKMKSYGIIDISIDIKTSTALKWIAPIGTKVKSRDSVVTLYKAVKLDVINQILQDKLGTSYKDENGKTINDYTVEQHLKVPNNIDEAIVSDVYIQENKRPIIPKTVKTPDYSFARSSKKAMDDYFANMDRKVIFDQFPEYVAVDRLKPIEMDRNNYKTVYTVRVRLIKIHKLVVADKLTNRYGGKGVVSTILPDSEMPVIDGKRVELIMNPYSTINRKIPSVISEVALGNCAHKIHDLVEVYKKTAAGKKKILPLVTKIYPGRFDNLTVDDFITLHNSSRLEDVYYFNVGCYSKYNPEKIQKIMDELGVTTQAEVYLPETDVTDLEELKENLPKEEYDKVVESMKGKFKKVEKPLMAGYVTIEHLYHIPSYSNKVSSDLVPNIKNAEPISGRGRYRVDGQKIGEIELAALLSRNAKKFIRTYREHSEKELNQRFLDNLLGLGLMVVDDKGYAMGGSALKTSMNAMKRKYGLLDKKGGK